MDKRMRSDSGLLRREGSKDPRFRVRVDGSQHMLDPDHTQALVYLLYGLLKDGMRPLKPILQDAGVPDDCIDEAVDYAHQAAKAFVSRAGAHFSGATLVGFFRLYDERDMDEQIADGVLEERDAAMRKAKAQKALDADSDEQ